jgi:hypothetical protein
VYHVSIYERGKNIVLGLNIYLKPVITPNFTVKIVMLFILFNVYMYLSLSVCLSTEAASISYCVVPDGRVVGEQWIVMNVGGGIHCLILVISSL